MTSAKKKTRRANRSLRLAVETAEEAAHLDGLIAGTRFRRALHRAELEEQRRALAHTAREIAADLGTIAVSLDHDPLDDDEVTKHANVIRIIASLTSGRRPLPKQTRKTEAEPFTIDDLRKGAVNQLGSLWAAWTQVFNRTEFANDQDAMIAVTRTLRALRLAFWDSERSTPLPRSKRDAEFLRRVSVLSHRHLAPSKRRPRSRTARCDRTAALSTCTRDAPPFFVWSAPDSMSHTLRSRRDPPDGELSSLADKITDSPCGSLGHGYGYAFLKRDLPADFDSATRRAAVRAVLYAHLRDGTFNPGPDAYDLTTATQTAGKTLKSVLAHMGFKGELKSLFDAARKRHAKLT